MVFWRDLLRLHTGQGNPGLLAFSTWDGRYNNSVEE